MSSSSWTAEQIRAEFLRYFREQGHEVVPSSGVVPRGDATLLFTNSGMVQFKDVFTGRETRPYRRATSSQKCIRMSGKHNDLENVGRTARHHTFFEMLGNFSFGDYFKKDAIRFAWELLVGRLGLPKERLVITVFGGEDGVPADDEARAIWKEVTGFGDDRIFGLGKKDNFWSMGDTGPCGPCTEIHFAMGDMEPNPKTFGDEPRPDGTGWVELWNLVFMQFERHADGKLTPLPAQSVDTGMGLERITAALQGKTSNYETDLFRPFVELAAKISGKTYHASNSEDDVSMRVLADHARLSAMCLSEGVTPGNLGREYALRQVMRRAIRHGVKLGIDNLFFHELTAEVVNQLGETYPLLRQRRDSIVAETKKEEELFRKTLHKGLALIEGFKDFRVENSSKVMPGKVAFDLHATYGFPLDLTEVIGEERGFRVDRADYEREVEHHAAISRKGGAITTGTEEIYKEARAKLAKPVQFTGYDKESDKSSIVLLLREGQFVSAIPVGVEAEIVVEHTPFYGESGGQVGDRGVLRAEDALFRVTDTLKPVDGLVLHRGVVERGSFGVQDDVELEVDHALRSATRRNHSATHLLHWALRKVLGTSVEQRGSKVGPEVLRFDYSTDRAMTAEEIQRVEDLVNDEVLANLDVHTEVTNQENARNAGAMMIFEENYGDVVRMLRIGRESVELCGGTHARRTGDIGLFKITSDEAVARGIRRVTAATGFNALRYFRETEEHTKQAAAVLKTAPSDLATRVTKLLEEQREQQKLIAELKRKLVESGGGPAVEEHTAGTLRVGFSTIEETDPNVLRERAEQLRTKNNYAVLLLAGRASDGTLKLVVTSAKENQSTHPAGKLVSALATALGGRGGGRPDLAQGGTPAGVKAEAARDAFFKLFAG